MEFIKKYLNLKKLNRREKNIIYAAGCILGLLIIVHFIVTPFFDGRKQKRKSLQAKKVELQEMRHMQADYRVLQDKLKLSKARSGSREKGFSLNSFMVQMAGQSGIKDRISSIKPSKTLQKQSNLTISRVEMKLDAITLEQLTKYLHEVEMSKNMVTVRKISISKKDSKQGLINVLLQVETVEA
jgi:general secretion pathway protein M